MRKSFYLFLIIILSFRFSFALNSRADNNRNKVSKEINYLIPKTEAAEFVKNPLKYVKRNFSIKDYINPLDNDRIYLCVFNSSKGNLTAEISSEGKILKTKILLKDSFLPFDVRNEMYKTYPGYTVTGIKYKAYGNDILKKQVYKIYLVKDRDKRKLVIKK